MGIPGILKEIGKGERTALAKLAIEHLEKTQRPLRIAIDAAIWNFQNQAGQGGKNPALRTLFFRLLKLLALPIHPVFVYDGKQKPLTKRGRTVSRYSTCIPNETSKQLIHAFRFPHHTAPGEAEAECAFLQRNGLVDAVMSQDVDAIMFGSTLTLRDWSKEGTRGNKTPTHVNVLDLSRIRTLSRLDPDGMILVALLSGGDYDEVGVPGFGATLSCEIARAGFGTDLLDLVRKDDRVGLEEWRQRLQYELETNESGYFRTRHKTLKVPDSFPNLTILNYYMQPAVSKTDDLLALETRWAQAWDTEIDVPALREYTANTFDWAWRSGACRFVRCFAQPLFQDRLRRGMINSSAFEAHSITEKRQHFINDGIPELRLSVTPADVVGINIEAEEQNPDSMSVPNEDEDELGLLVDREKDVFNDNIHDEQRVPASPSKKRTFAPWDPYTPEKWWIPETLLQLGLPAIVEDWHQLQRDIRADPKRFATRKASKAKRDPRQIDVRMQTGAIRQYFSLSGKPGQKHGDFDIQEAELNSTAAHMLVSKDAQLPNPAKVRVEAQARSLSSRQVAVSLAEQKVESVLEESLQDETRSVEVQDSHLKQINVLSEDIPASESEAQMPSPSKRTRVVKPIAAPALKSLMDVERDPTTDVADPTVQSRPLQKTAVGGNVRHFHTTTLVEPSRGADASKLLAVDAEISKVTQRKPRRTRLQPETSLSPPSSHARKLRPIESFFTQTKQPSLPEMSNEKCPPSPASEQTAVSQQETVGQKRHSAAFRRAALARESLPGTWTEAGAERKVGKKAPRVSYVDLVLE